MTVASKIRNALMTIMTEGEANACDIRKGYHYNGTKHANGWYYTPFGCSPITLGKNEAEALETIEQIKEARDYDDVSDEPSSKEKPPCCVVFPSWPSWAYTDEIFRPFEDIGGKNEEEIISSLPKEEIYSRLDRELEAGWDVDLYILWLRGVAMNAAHNSKEEMTAAMKALPAAVNESRSSLLLPFLNGDYGTKTKGAIIKSLPERIIKMFFIYGDLRAQDAQIMALDALPPHPFDSESKKDLWRNRHLYTADIRERF